MHTQQNLPGERSGEDLAHHHSHKVTEIVAATPQLTAWLTRVLPPAMLESGSAGLLGLVLPWFHGVVDLTPRWLRSRTPSRSAFRCRCDAADRVAEELEVSNIASCSAYTPVASGAASSLQPGEPTDSRHQAKLPRPRQGPVRGSSIQKL